MTKITRPNVPGTLSQAGISEGVAAQAGAGLGAIGSQQTQLGKGIQQSNAGALSRQLANQVEQMGKQYFEQSKRAHQTAVLTNSISDATQQFEKQFQERSSQIVDEDGNPTFMSLSEDIGKIGNQVKEDISNKIIDPEVSNRFRNDFSNHVSNKQMTALKKARNQQIQFSKVSLDNGLGSLLQQASKDDIDNLTSYETQAHRLLDDALTSGLVNEDERQALKESFSSSAREQSISNLIESDTQQAAVILSSPSTDLGISEELKSNLDERLKAKIGSDVIQAEKVAKQAINDDLNKKAQVAENVDAKIEADAIREDELLRLENNLEPKAFKKLKTKFVNQSKKRTKKERQLGELSSKISSGESITGTSPTIVDEHFNRLVEVVSTESGQPLTLDKKAELAVSYKGKVRAFAREVNGSLINGSVTNAGEFISAYTYVRDRKGQALDGNTFTTKAMMVAETAEMLVERANMSPQDALLKAREQILEVKDEFQKERAKQFRKESDFGINNLKDTVAESVGAEGFFGLNKQVSNDAASTFKELARLAYEQTGDVEASKKIAASQMDKTHGVSDFNGDDTYMFAPPELLFPDLPPQALRAQLNNDISSILPEGKEASSIKIVADSRTMDTFSYALSSEQDIDGFKFDIPLVNPNTGELVRWFPDTKTLKEEQEAEIKIQKQTKLREAQALRTEQLIEENK